MRFYPLVLLLGCLDVSYVDEDEANKCDRGYEFVWTELDGGTCGSFGEVIDDMTECPVTLAAACLGSNDVECENDDRWSWRKVADSDVERLTGPSCESRYELKRR